jgi:hypothetical protein
MGEYGGVDFLESLAFVNSKPGFSFLAAATPPGGLFAGTEEAGV